MTTLSQNVIHNVSLNYFNVFSIVHKPSRLRIDNAKSGCINKCPVQLFGQRCLVSFLGQNKCILSHGQGSHMPSFPFVCLNGFFNLKFMFKYAEHYLLSSKRLSKLFVVINTNVSVQLYLEIYL